MGRRVDARDVLDPNGRTRRSFRGRVLGVFRRTGPNRWDDYEYEAEPEGELDVLPGVAIQVEPVGAEFRMRAKGRVVRVEWSPGEDVRRAIGRDVRELRRRFLAECVDGFGDAVGQGAGAVIARKLRD
jgi:hypothetical protein